MSRPPFRLRPDELVKKVADYMGPHLARNGRKRPGLSIDAAVEAVARRYDLLPQSVRNVIVADAVIKAARHD